MSTLYGSIVEAPNGELGYSASVTRFSLLYEERFHEYIGFTYQTIMQSGRYYRLYQAELSGVDLYAKENKDLVMELGKGKMVKDVLTIYEAYRKAFIHDNFTSYT